MKRRARARLQFIVFMNPAQSDNVRARRILCVDDEPTVRELLHIYLRREGFEVETAPDGLAAWLIISAHPSRFDAVITDNQMPHMTGLELVEKLRVAQGQLDHFANAL